MTVYISFEDLPCFPLWISMYLQTFSWLLFFKCSNLPKILMEFGVKGSPFAPHLSFGWLRAKNVVRPKSASLSSVMSLNEISYFVMIYRFINNSAYTDGQYLTHTIWQSNLLFSTQNKDLIHLCVMHTKLLRSTLYSGTFYYTLSVHHNQNSRRPPFFTL